MSEGELPESIKRFVFELIDSVEQLEILLLMHARRTQFWSAESLSREMRSNPDSALTRLHRLHGQGLLKQNPEAPGEYIYSPSHPAWDKTVTELAEVYAKKRHRVLELVFTPAKQARLITDAFRISKKGGKS